MEPDQFPHLELSNAISELIKLNAISISEHTQLSEMLQQENPDLLSLEGSSKSSEELEHNLIKLVRSWHKPGALITNMKTGEDNTSPLGTFLHEKKKRQHAEHELKISLATSEVRSIKETQDEH
jgi:tryptophanyl-tRNA synthetase